MLRGIALIFAMDAPPIDRVELVCLEHLDVGFTAAPQEIARRQKEHLDHAIALCRERPDFCWTVESIWQLEQWLARTSDAGEREELIAFLRDGRIEIAGGYGNLHTATMDAELLLRSFEPADAIRAELGVAITACVQDDVPGFCALFPAAMAQHGIRWFLAGINTTFGGGTSLGPPGKNSSNNPFWWEGLDGSRVLTWVAYGSYVEAEAIGLGVWSRDGDAESKLPAALAELSKSGYRFDRVLVMASTGDNGDPNAARSILRKVDAWNASHATPKIGFTTPSAFLARLERDAIRESGRPDGGFPIARGDWSGHWEPVKANSPAASALYREAQALLPGAEALSLRAAHELGRPYPQHDLDQAFRNLLLYSEHSAAAGVGWPKLTTREEVEAGNQFCYQLAFDAAETLRAIVGNVTAAYAEVLASDGAAKVVANPVSFARGGVPGFALRREAASDDAPAHAEDSAAAMAGALAGALDGIELFTLSERGFGGGILAPLDPARDGVRAFGGAGNRWSPWLELSTERAPDADHDPVRLLARLAPFNEDIWEDIWEGNWEGDREGDLIAPPTLRFTTAAGVISPADFLPGARPTAFCTSGAIELTATCRRKDGAEETRIATVLLREPFAFEPTAPRWLGPAALEDPATLWIRLLERSVRGETRDQGIVEFMTVEPALEPRREFHLSVDGTSDSGTADSAATRTAELMRAAWAWRCPLVAREFKPWFPSPPRVIGTEPLVTTSSDRLLVLSCRPELAPGRAVLVRVQEIGGEPVSDATVALALPGFAGGQTVTLRAHEVRTLRFEGPSRR